jgi:glycosyltransferase involved in cell wall biosynthesis
LRLVYIHQHFMTNRGAGGTRSYDVARHMVRAGHAVHVICGIYDISGLAPMPWYRWFRRETIEGIDVTVCNVSYSNKFGGVRRTWAFLWFAALAVLASIRVRAPDLVFATSTPLTVGIPGYLAARIKRVPFVFEVRDIWPESFVRSGWVKGTELSIRLMGRLEAFIYRHARKILLVSPGFEKRLIERGLPPRKLKTILLGADGELFRDVKPDHAFLDKYGLHGKTLAIYTGAHGKANGLDYIVSAAEYARNDANIAYVLIGEGMERERLIQTARGKSLTNIVFAEAVPKEQLAGILAVCHIGLMILKNIREPRPVTPNKIFDYMFMGMPALVNFEGPTLEMVTAEGCGWYVDPQRPEELAEKVRRLAGDPELRVSLGRRGQIAARDKYDRKIIARQLTETFEGIISCGDGA